MKIEYLLRRRMMKKIVLSLVTLFAIQALARPLPYSTETLLVKNIDQYANLMPGPFRPENPYHTTFTVEVMSNGCTDESSFDVQVQQDLGRQLVTIVRTRPDYCRGIQRRIELELTSRNLVSARQKPVQLANPLLVKVMEVH